MDALAQRPELAQYFIKGSLLRWLRRRHPYDFIETYQVLERLYRYKLGYVNLGLWDQGEKTVEAGQKLTLHVLDRLQLGKGDYLVDAGSGLGQGAVDAIQRYDLERVLAINTNTRQIGYAGALAALAKVNDRIVYAPADACATVDGIEDGSVAGISAIECIGHFDDPLRFFRGAFNALRPGGRLAFCLNVQTAPFGFWQRRIARASFGFVPDRLETWTERLTAARLEVVETEDLTDRVLEPVARIVRARLATDSGSDLSWLMRKMMRWQLGVVARSVAAGSLGYALVVARRP